MLQLSLSVPRNFFLLVPTSLLIGFVLGYFMWALPLLLMRASGVNVLGVVFSLSFLLNALLSFSTGFAADVMGRKAILVFATTLFALGALIIFMAPYWLLPVGIIIVFASSSLHGPALDALLAESMQEEARGKAFGILQFSTLIGLALGSTVLGIVTQSAGLNLALGITVFLALLAIPLRMMLIETKTHKSNVSVASASPALLRNAVLLFSNKALLPFSLILIGGSLVSWIMQFMPGYLSEVLGLGESVIGLAYSLTMISQAIGQPVAGWFSDRYGAKRALIVNKVGSAISLILFVLLSTVNPILALAFPFVVGAWLSAFNNVGWSLYIAQNTDEDHRGTIYGSASGLEAISQAPAPILGALLWQIEPRLVFVGTAIGWFALMPLLMRLRDEGHA